MSFVMNEPPQFMYALAMAIYPANSAATSRPSNPLGANLSTRRLQIGSGAAVPLGKSAAAAMP